MKTRTASYHAQSDGMVERFNKSLEGLLQRFANDKQSDWDDTYAICYDGVRSSLNETTGYTPNMTMLGREITVPLDIQFTNSLDNKKFLSKFVSNLH